MLKKSNFTIEHIMKLHNETKCAPVLLERVVYAFGLLEALVLAGLDFTFKGGTCLMVLMVPKRLSIDIDILVEPGIDIDIYIQKAASIQMWRPTLQRPQIRPSRSRMNWYLTKR